MNEFNRTAALNAVINSVELKARFPEQVFRSRWPTFFFFESDKMFAASFIDILSEILWMERSSVACLLNYDQMAIPQSLEGALFIDDTMSGEKYVHCLKEGGPSLGWLFRVDRYGCASESARWCIYCEKANDVAVIALEMQTVIRLASPLKKLHAEPIQQLLRGGKNEVFPFNEFIDEWRRDLLVNYCVK